MRRRDDSGFAMLFVLLMAGMIAITLYMALPRAAFEAQREKEQTLIDRGGQYKRAIQLYVRQNKRWPAKIEDLEDTNGKRYLRRRYVDPMTGKDEWRPIHVGPNGVLTDSLIKQAKDKDKGDAFTGLITDLGGVSAPTGAPGAGNPGLRKRPSDQLNNAGTGVGDPTQPNNQQPGQTSVAGGPPPANVNGPPAPSNLPQGLQPPTPNNGQPMANGLPQQLQQPGNTTQQPASAQASNGLAVLGGVGGGVSAPQPVTNPPTPNAAAGGLQGQIGGVQGSAFGQAGTNGSVPAANTPAGAAQLIQGLLTTPRPGGLAGTQMGTGVGQVQGGGIAGFASKFEGEAIKIYNDQTEYQKWEFVYDMSKDTMVTGPQQAIPQPPGPNSTSGFNNSTTSTGTNTNSNPTGTTTPSAVGH